MSVGKWHGCYWRWLVGTSFLVIVFGLMLAFKEGAAACLVDLKLLSIDHWCVLLDYNILVPESCITGGNFPPLSFPSPLRLVVALWFIALDDDFLCLICCPRAQVGNESNCFVFNLFLFSSRLLLIFLLLIQVSCSTLNQNDNEYFLKCFFILKCFK